MACCVMELAFPCLTWMRNTPSYPTGLLILHYTGPVPLKGIKIVHAYLDLYMKYILQHDQKQLDASNFPETYLFNYLLMLGLLVSPRTVINAKMLTISLTAGEAPEEKQLFTELYLNYPQYLEEIFNEIVPA